jgi:hypothetical protein
VYLREFICTEIQRNEVVHKIRKGSPLNMM